MAGSRQHAARRKQSLRALPPAYARPSAGTHTGPPWAPGHLGTLPRHLGTWAPSLGTWAPGHPPSAGAARSLPTSNASASATTSYGCSSAPITAPCISSGWETRQRPPPPPPPPRRPRPLSRPIRRRRAAATRRRTTRAPTLPSWAACSPRRSRPPTSSRSGASRSSACQAQRRT